MQRFMPEAKTGRNFKPGELDYMNERPAALFLRQDKFNKSKAVSGKSGLAELRQSRIDERLLRDNARASSEEAGEKTDDGGVGADEVENSRQMEEDYGYAEPDNSEGDESSYDKSLRAQKFEDMQARQAEEDQAEEEYGEDMPSEQTGSGTSIVGTHIKHFILALVPGYEYWMLLRGALGQGGKEKVSLLNKIWIAINALVRSFYILLTVGVIAIVAMIMEASWWDLLKAFFSSGVGLFEALKLLF